VRFQEIECIKFPVCGFKKASASFPCGSKKASAFFPVRDSKRHTSELDEVANDCVEKQCTRLGTAREKCTRFLGTAHGKNNALAFLEPTWFEGLLLDRKTMHSLPWNRAREKMHSLSWNRAREKSTHILGTAQENMHSLS